MPANSTDNAATAYTNQNRQALGGSIVASPGPAITGIAENVKQETSLQQEVEGRLMELQEASQEVADLLGNPHRQRLADAWAGTWRLLEQRSGPQGGAAVEQLRGVWAP